MSPRRNYRLLLTGQFLGAFGDNAILALLVGQLTYLQQRGEISADQLRTASTVFATLLFVPYVLLAPLAGFLNDRHSKTTWLAGGNALKLLGALACAFAPGGDPVWQGLGYLVVGIGATVYGPAKYGILPEILPREQLVRANGLVELLTLLAILTGAIGGAWLSDHFREGPLPGFLVVCAVFTAALGCSLGMRRTPSHPQVRLADSVRSFVRHGRALVAAPRLVRMLFGTALFWICGAAMKINFQPWGLQVLGFDNNTDIALLGLWLSVGVMIGSLAAGRLHAVGDFRATPYYGAALAGMLAVVAAIDGSAAWTSPSWSVFGAVLPLPVAGVLVAAGVAAGLFLIPLNAGLQAESDPASLGKTIAVQNLSDNLGMCLAGGYVFLAARAGLSPGAVFLGLAGAVLLSMVFLRFRRAPVAAAAPSDTR